MFNLWFVFKNIFRTNSEGQKLFYPNGILATGYVIPSDEVYKRLRNGYIAVTLATLLFIILGAVLLFVLNLNIYVAILIPVILYLVMYYTWVHTQTRDLAKVKK